MCPRASCPKASWNTWQRTSTPRKPTSGSRRLEYVVQSAGPERAVYLLERLKREAFNMGRPLRFQRTNALCEHDHTRQAAGVPGRSGYGTPDQESHSLERHGHGGFGRIGRVPGSEAIFRRMPRRQPSTRWPSTTSSAVSKASSRRTRFSSRATSLRVSMRAPSWKVGSPKSSSSTSVASWRREVGSPPIPTPG